MDELFEGKPVHWRQTSLPDNDPYGWNQVLCANHTPRLLAFIAPLEFQPIIEPSQPAPAYIFHARKIRDCNRNKHADGASRSRSRLTWSLR